MPANHGPLNLDAGPYVTVVFMGFCSVSLGLCLVCMFWLLEGNQNVCVCGHSENGFQEKVSLIPSTIISPAVNNKVNPNDNELSCRC